MKNSNNTATTTIAGFEKTLTQAIALGFKLPTNIEDTIEYLHSSCLDFLNDNLDKLPTLTDKCEVNQSGHHQYVSYGNFRSDGEIVDWGYYYGKKRQKVYHSEFLYIDDFSGKAYRMRLWCYSK